MEREWMTATDAQVRLMMKERREGKTQEQAAVKANLRSRKTVGKYEKLGKLPSELKQSRKYRTREDAFSEDWGMVEKMLEEAPGLEAKALFEWLQEQKPGKYQEGQLRTFQRRAIEPGAGTKARRSVTNRWDLDERSADHDRGRTL